MTHDIETEKGRDYCTELMNVDESFGIKSSFQIVPEGRYEISEALFKLSAVRGFEITFRTLTTMVIYFVIPRSFAAEPQESMNMQSTTVSRAFGQPCFTETWIGTMRFSLPSICQFQT